MSYGLTPYEFVQQVFYAQEKVLLDFWPNDDKYKEVLVEANLVLQELQNSEDWSWLRERIVLGDCHPEHPGDIPEFRLPPWVYKVSTLHNDCVKLHYPTYSSCCNHHDEQEYDEYDFISVPYISRGRLNSTNNRQRLAMATNVSNFDLGAAVVGDILTFNRPLTPDEACRIAVCDVQRRIEPLHICGPKCKGVNPKEKIDYTLDDDGNWKNPCAQIEDKVFTEIPDPNYVVMRTAALHAEGSPPAQGRIATLTDNAQKILSAMRSNDASYTEPDIMAWESVDFINVI